MKLSKFLETSPIWAAYRLHEQLVVPMHKALKEQDLTFLQSLILTALYFEDAPVSPSEMVQLFGTSLPNMSHSLKHLRQLGLVERQIDNADARVSRYVITNQARASLAHIINVHNMAQEALEQKFSATEIHAWCNMATRLID